MNPMKETPAEDESAGAGDSSYFVTVGATAASCPAGDVGQIEKPTADTSAALEFLQRMRPSGPWCLTSITVEGHKKTTTATFTSDDIDRMRAWIDQRQGQQNIYFALNPLRGSISKKAEKTDVAAMEWLHCDLDPRAGEDPAAERERALKVLREATLAPAPTVILNSGGGVQAFWRLDEAVPTDGKVERCEELEAYNQQLEILFQADRCHNLDRVLRLPGTINLPDEKKRAKGREPALAELIEFHDDRVYSIGQFKPAVRVQSGKLTVTGQTKIKVSGNVPRLASVDELPDMVTDRTKMLIVQGSDPDDPTKYGSRSEALFAVCCELVRAGCSDETIFSVLMDPDFGISASVLDKPRPEKYAARQIEQAREQAIAPELAELNAKHAVIQSIGGKTRIASFRCDPRTKRHLIEFQSFDDFRNFYSNREMEVGTKGGQPITKPLGNWWISHPRRRTYGGIIFAPGEDETSDHLNLWQGFGVKARAGSWRLMLRHIYRVLASRDRAAFRYVIRWAAWALQNPGRPAEVAIAFKGGRGTGKGTFGRALIDIFGQHGLHIMSSGHFTGRFNSHLRDVCLLFADEAYAPEDRKAEGRLKGLITEPTIPIEGKGVDVVEVPNHLHVVIASNERWVVPAGPDERRFAVFVVSSWRRGDKPYFAAIRREMDSGGREAMLHDLLRLDLKGWHPRDDVPKTAALREQQMSSLRGVEQAWFDFLEGGQLPSCQKAGGGRVFVATEGLVKHLRAERRREDVSRNEVATLLRQLGCEKVTKTRPRGYIVPALDEARAAWDATFFPGPWDDAEEWQQAEPQSPF